MAPICRSASVIGRRFTHASADGPGAACGTGCSNRLATDADKEYAMIDSTIVRAHQHSAGAKKKTAKIKRSGAAKAD